MRSTGRRIILLLTTALWLAGSSSTTARQVFGEGGASSASKVRAVPKLSVDRVPAGSSVKMAVVLEIDEGWHINSSTPSYDYLIGTSVELQPKEGMILADLRYPPGEDVLFAFADDALSVYKGSVKIYFTVRFSERLSQGRDTLQVRIRVQACNDQVCLAPSSLNVPIPVTIAGADETPATVDDELFSSYDPGSNASSLDSGSTDLAKVIDERGTFVAFFAIFLIGLALNLTPCVYPMMSVTVSLFGSQIETKTVRVLLKAVTYVSGIVTMYTVLGVSAALSGTLFGSWLQSPWVLGGIGVLLIGLALSSFGLYQIQVPYWLTSKLGGTTGTGLVSLFVSGLVVGVFAAPCIGPPVIALLTLVSSKADPLFGFWVFFTLSLGLGFPYLILGTFSGMIKKIPKSGAWLVWVERIFGVILTAAGLFYLSLAFFPKYAALIVPIALILGGFYLGFIEPSGREKIALRRIKWAFGVIAVAFGLVAADALREPGITWEPFTESRIEEARRNGKPVMMDFYADWCIPCLELDRKTFTNGEVIAATEGFVRLKVDLTHFDSPEAEALRKQFNIAGVPTVVFLNSAGEEVLSSRVVGYVPPSEFLEKVKGVIQPG